MSNFLDNLVARTLNLAPVVQPRLQSRFERVNATTPVAPDQTVEVETPTERTERTATVHPEPRVDAPKPIIAAEPPQVKREQPRVDFHQVINTIRNTYVEPREIVQVPVVEKVRERVVQETRIHTEKTDSHTQIRENPTLAQPPSVTERNPPNPRLKTVEPAPVTKEAPVITPKPIAPKVVTRIEPAPVAPTPRRPEVPPAFPAEPSETINVTIGRVDVRAVFSQQATPPAARPRTASVNSLDDYLKQRSEGRR